ncbi:chitobiase/beta-hexosaminidase C-terminal domain-containing protein [Acetobacterium wieringae]|uniref:Chitobiase/beta-hexosaminidase C-terminal domain-containing protein n=1 Tax=Acetobacterium wieringae TaxID=52694 RepID=A0ABY6HCY7_9FIRM|nr:chitobiase/beta-hexosaminidase C-terminal domain-containing protein [Acetobacterium wieringae]UYO62377.1 chitobiase/beta-hexosaminidase C-terminal domain-containing protein [Acetobacterium wieringae]VUZ22969.1 Uncharacterised protein [Acetobacterium wieringae]
MDEQTRDPNLNDSPNEQNPTSSESTKNTDTSKKSRKTLSIVLVISIVLILSLSGGLAYAYSTNLVTLPFVSIQVNEPEITAIANADGSSTVTINNPNTVGTVYYTIDGSEPLTNSKKYESPITINTSTSLNARVIDEKDHKSDVSTQQFTIVEKNVETPTVADTVPATTTTYSNDDEIMDSIAGQWTDGKNSYIYFQSVKKISHDCPIQFKDMRDGMKGTYGIMNTSGNLLNIKIYSQENGGITIDNTFTIDIGTQGDGIINIWGIPWTYVSDSPIFQ